MDTCPAVAMLIRPSPAPAWAQHRDLLVAVIRVDRNRPPIHRAAAAGGEIRRRQLRKLIPSNPALRRIFSDQRRRRTSTRPRGAALVMWQILFPVNCRDVGPEGVEGAVPVQAGDSPPAWCTGCTAPGRA